MATAILMAAPAHRADDTKRKPWKVVLVDDTEDLRFIMRRLLTASKSFEIAGEAPDGAKGVEVAKKTQPDLLLLDLLMPVMDGWEALPRIREVSPHTRIVVVSGQDKTAMERRALALGAAAYIEKGTPSRDILRTLQDIMDGA